MLIIAISGSNVLGIKRDLADRAYTSLGSSTNSNVLRSLADQPGSSPPNVIWLKDGTQLSGDGVRVVINTTTTAGTPNRTSSNVRIFNFNQSDAGVYQCVFYDTPSQGGEVSTTRPIKLDTGK